MAKKYLITYELKNKQKDYSDFYAAIKALSNWWHYVDATWIVKTDLSSVEIYNRIWPSMDEKDYLLIIEVNPVGKYGKLPADAWKWLDS